MLTAFARAIGQLGDPRLLRLLGFSVLLAIACFAAAWFAIAWLLTATAFVPAGWLETVLDVLGGLATLVLTWFLFPLVASAFVALFLDEVAAAVEARHYPSLPPAKGMPWLRAVGHSLRFLGLVVAVNAALLLLLLLVPPVAAVGYYVGNGWLLGREYFDLVALRRASPEESRSLRLAHGAELLTIGAASAFLLTLPFVNFVVPVVLTATLVHRCEAWRANGS